MGAIREVLVPVPRPRSHDRARQGISPPAAASARNTANVGRRLAGLTGPGAVAPSRARTVATSATRCRRCTRSRRSAPPTGCIAPRHGSGAPVRSVTVARSPHASCRRTITCPEPSSACFTLLICTPRWSTVTTGSGVGTAVAGGHQPQRQVERVGLVQHIVEAGPVRQHADRHGVPSVVGIGIGILRGP